jgi:type I restriction enzyme S subunit
LWSAIEMSEWEDAQLGDVLTLQRGFDITEKELTPGDVPVVSSSGVAYFHDQARVQAPGVVIGRKGSLGTVYLLKVPFWPHDTTLWVKDFKGNDPSFCHLLLKSLNLDTLDVGAANPTLNRNHAHRLAVRLPSLRTQQRVSALMAALDELIEINERRCEILERVARAHFLHKVKEPTRLARETAKVQGAAPGGLPAGWRSCSLGDIARLNYGKALPKARRHPGGVSVVSSAGIIDTHNVAVADGPGLVIGRKGNVGSVWWVEGEFHPIDTTYYVESDLPLEFLYWTLLEAEFVDSHAAVPGLNRDQALALEVLLPPVDVIDEIASLHRSAFRASSAHRKVIDAARHLRGLLLPRLVTGRLDISEIDLGIFTPTEPSDA